MHTGRAFPLITSSTFRFATKKTERLAAIGLMAAAVSIFSILDTTAKYLVGAGGLPIMQIVFVRFAGNIVLNILLFGPALFLAAARTTNRTVHFARSLFMAITTGFNFLALQYLQLDQTITLFFLAPLLVAALGGPLLGEWIGWRRLTAIVIGFSGVLFVTRPGFGGIHQAVIFSFGAALSYALYSLSTRYLTRLEAPQLAQITAPLAGTLLFAAPALTQWQWPASPFTLALLLSLGFIGGFGHWLLVLAHKHAPAPILSPFTYVGLPSMIVLEWLVFNDLPTWWTLLGACIIMASGAYLLWREKS